MATMNVSLPDPLKAWVEDRVKSRRYDSAAGRLGRARLVGDGDGRRRFDALELVRKEGHRKLRISRVYGQRFNVVMVQKHDSKLQSLMAHINTIDMRAGRYKWRSGSMRSWRTRIMRMPRSVLK